MSTSQRNSLVLVALLAATHFFAPASGAQKAADQSVSALVAAQGDSLILSATKLEAGELAAADHAKWLTETNAGIVGRTYVPAQKYLTDANGDAKELVKRSRALGKALKGKK